MSRARRGGYWRRLLLPFAVSAALVAWVVWEIDDPGQLWNDLWLASPLLLAGCAVLIAVSFVFRAKRWQCLIGQPVAFAHVFSSVMIGAAINGVIPRGGEVAKVFHLNRFSALPPALLAATIVVERLLDVLTLIGLLAFAVLLGDVEIEERFPGIVRAAPAVMGVAIAGTVFVAAMGIFPRQTEHLVKRLVQRLPEQVGQRLGRLLGQGLNGVAFLRSGPQLAMMIWTSAGIWLCQWVAFALGLAAYGLMPLVGLKGSAVGFSITGASVFVPSAGAIGAFHKLGHDVLTLFYSVEPARALAAVTVIHLMMYYFVPVGVGVLAWLGQGVFITRIRADQASGSD